MDSGGNLYIADTGNNLIRMVSTDGTITTVAGSGAGSYQGDGGPATSAGLFQPNGVAIDSAGNIYIDDSGDYLIRMVTPDGMITTIAGNGAVRGPNDSSGDGGAATSARLSLTMGVAAGQGGTVYIADPLYGVRLLTHANWTPGDQRNPHDARNQLVAVEPSRSMKKSSRAANKMMNSSTSLEETVQNRGLRRVS